ncbi:MAG: copper-binding protein [Salinarimonas sp.]
MTRTTWTAALAALLLSTGFAAASPTEGEIRKIDDAAGKLTVRHGPIENLGMDAMTMVFRMPETGMASGLTVGDRVVFEADRVNGALTITRIEKAN